MGGYQHVRAVQERNIVTNENPAVTWTSNTSLTDKLGQTPAPCPYNFTLGPSRGIAAT